MHGRFSAKEKIRIINKAKSKISIVQICKEEHISRTTMYDWLKKYKRAPLYNKKKELTNKFPKGINHWKKLDKEAEQKIIQLAVENPLYSGKLISKIFKLAPATVWTILKTHKLNSVEKRQQAFSLVHKVQISHSDKLLILKRFEKGEKVSSLCKEFGISRTLFYRILKRYRQGSLCSDTENLRPKGEKHWRFVPGANSLVLEIVIEHPQFPAQMISDALKLQSGKKILGSHGVYNILKKLDLTTCKKRLAYAGLHTQSHSAKESAGLSLGANQDGRPSYRYLLLAFGCLLLMFEISIIKPVLFRAHLKPRSHGFQVGSFLNQKVKPPVQTLSQKLQQDFHFGVLTLNTNKPVYSQGETALLEFGLLGKLGQTICSGTISLQVTYPSSRIVTLSTENGTIQQSKTCTYNIVYTPDYLSQLNLSEYGRYYVQVEAKTKDSTHKIEDTILIQNFVPFDVNRTAFPTRIYPLTLYKAQIVLKANRDYQGSVFETVPSQVVVSHISGLGILTKDVHTQNIKWRVDWQKGKTYSFDYSLSFPKTSPMLYAIGPLRFYNDKQDVIYEEARVWYVAADTFKK